MNATLPAHPAGPDASVPAGDALVLSGVTRRFGGLTVVDGVDVALPAGGRLAVIGPNGAGKTTLFRMIAGELPVSAGTITLFGEDVTRVAEHRRARRGVARTFQVSTLFGSLSVAQNVRLAAQAATPAARVFWRPAHDRDEAAGRAAEALERVGLGGRSGDRVSELSHGEQRQLEIAMALAGSPRLLLLDEPAAGLAATERAVLRDLLSGLPRDVTVVLVEHDMSLALGLADDVLCLADGRTLAHGTPGEIRSDPAVQAVYLGRRG